MSNLENKILEFKVDCFKDMLRQGKLVKIKVFGGSMWPFFKNGECVIVSPVNPQNIAVGDIVLTYKAESLLCHRVFRKKAGFIQTKADALAGLSSLIKKEEVLGRVIAKEAKGRVFRLDGRLSRFYGLLISRLTLVSAHCYPALRFIKRG